MYVYKHTRAPRLKTPPPQTSLILGFWFVLVGGLLEETSVSLFPSILSLFSLSLGTYRAIVHAQKANQKQEQEEEGGTDQGKWCIF
jgi:hypothetical protein